MNIVLCCHPACLKISTAAGQQTEDGHDGRFEAPWSPSVPGQAVPQFGCEGLQRDRAAGAKAAAARAIDFRNACRGKEGIARIGGGMQLAFPATSVQSAGARAEYSGGQATCWLLCYPCVGSLAAPARTEARKIKIKKKYLARGLTSPCFLQQLLSAVQPLYIMSTYSPTRKHSQLSFSFSSFLLSRPSQKQPCVAR
ncbi:hypothetical protein GQ54DRAFT_95897 [Martensiomyces pterosporus]|nr:hypothetical protein GQ54DRAFT_95897 [Martensiomyces pterosporus]